MKILDQSTLLGILVCMCDQWQEKIMVREDHGLIRVLEGNLARLTQRLPTLRIEQIPTIMHELVVGIPPI